MATKPEIDSPAVHNPPKEALAMPVKHYPSSTKMCSGSKGNSIDGPTTGHEMFKK